MKNKIYIAGKVTGEDLAKCTMKFGIAQMELEKAGFEAINPLEVVGDWKATWEAAMKKCIKALVDCDAVYFLPDARQSPGAMYELEIANKLNIPTAETLETLLIYKKSIFQK